MHWKHWKQESLGHQQLPCQTMDCICSTTIRHFLNGPTSEGSLMLLIEPRHASRRPRVRALRLGIKRGLTSLVTTVLGTSHSVNFITRNTEHYGHHWIKFDWCHYLVLLPDRSACAPIMTYYKMQACFWYTSLPRLLQQYSRYWRSVFRIAIRIQHCILLILSHHFRYRSPKIYCICINSTVAIVTVVVVLRHMHCS